MNDGASYDNPISFDIPRTPERNAFGEVVVMPSPSSPLFNKTFQSPNRQSAIDSQKAFDESFDAFAFSESFTGDKKNGQPSSIDMKFSPTSGFPDDDPFFSGYNHSPCAEENNEKKNSDRDLALISPSTISPRTKPQSSSNISKKTSPKLFFPISPLDELDQIAMGVFGKEPSPSMETNSGANTNKEKQKRSGNISPTGNSPPRTSSSVEGGIERVETFPVPQSPKAFLSNQSPRSPSTQNPSLVLKRLQQIRAQEKQEKVVSTTNQLSARTLSIPVDSWSSDDSSPKPKLSRASPRSNDEVTLGDGLHSSFGTNEEDNEVNSSYESFEGPRDVKAQNENDYRKKIPVDEENTGANIDERIDANGEVSDLKFNTEEALSGNAISPMFKATNPSRTSDTVDHAHSIKRAKDNEIAHERAPNPNDEKVMTYSGSPSSKIRDEIRRLDAIASVNSQRPLRRSVKQPISYKEPSLTSKLRQGDTFFVKKNDINENAKSANEVLQDLAGSH